MNRKAINPTDWGLRFSMNQAEVVEGVTRHLHCSGQVDLIADPEAEMELGIAHVGVMPPQTLLGVARLALPDLLVEVEATAGD